MHGTQGTSGPPPGVSLVNPEAQDSQSRPAKPGGQEHTSTQEAGPGEEEEEADEERAAEANRTPESWDVSAGGGVG